MAILDPAPNVEDLEKKFQDLPESSKLYFLKRIVPQAVKIITDNNILPTDIPEYEKLEWMLRESNYLNEILMQTIPLGMDITDSEGVIIFVNDQLKWLFNKEMVGKKCSEIYCHEPGKCTHCPVCSSIEIGETQVFEIENFIDGKTYEVICKWMILNEKKAVLKIFVDITEQKKIQEMILQVATHDTLTGLPNRKLLSDRLDQAVHISERSWDIFAVLFIDLDRFKIVNDTLGHRIGDLLLREVANRLTKIFRSIDTIARYGWDEFIIIVQQLKLEKDIESIVDNITQELWIPFYIEGHEITIGASIGVSLYPLDAKNPDELISHSDANMYRIKNPGSK